MDFNNDGKLDIISGGYPGEIYLFRRSADGTFAGRETINDADGKPIKVGNASVPYATDWDGDGDLDLLIGNINGEVVLVTNDGTRDKPAFHVTGPVEVNGAKLRVAGGDAGPIVADWDGDGKPDLLVGSGDGSVQWFRNTGEKGKPDLAAGVALVPATGGRHGGIDPAPDADAKPSPGMRAKICVADYNGDGRPDLLLGDFNYAPQPPPKITPEQQAQRKAAQDKVRRLMNQMQQVQQSSAGDQTKRQKADELQRQLGDAIGEMQATVREAQPSRQQYHGFVWVYLRQPTAAAAAASATVPPTQ